MRTEAFACLHVLDARVPICFFPSSMLELQLESTFLLRPQHCCPGGMLFPSLDRPGCESSSSQLDRYLVCRGHTVLSTPLVSVLFDNVTSTSLCTTCKLNSHSSAIANTFQLQGSLSPSSICLPLLLPFPNVCT